MWYQVKYICDTAEDLGEKEPNSFDVVCALEVINTLQIQECSRVH